MRQLEFGLTGFYPPFEGARRARLAEELGFDIHGFSENHARATDCFGEMRDAARETTRIKLACGPVNFVTRNPGVIAAAVVPLQILSGSRVICNVESELRRDRRGICRLDRDRRPALLCRGSPGRTGGSRHRLLRHVGLVNRTRAIRCPRDA